MEDISAAEIRSNLESLRKTGPPNWGGDLSLGENEVRF